MQDGRTERRTASWRRLLLACLTSFFAGLLVGVAAPASAVDAPVFTGYPDSQLTSASATWTWTADGAATVECWLLTDGTPSPAPEQWFPCASGEAVALPAGDGDYALVVRATVQTPDGPVSAQSEASPFVRLDTVAPAVSVTSSPASPSTDRTPEWQVSVETGSTAVCTVTGPGSRTLSAACGTGVHAADLTGEPEGAWSFAVTATDAAGNTSTATAPAAYVLDVAPAAPVVTTVRSPGNDSAPAWSFVLPSDSTATCTLTDAAGTVLLSEACSPGWSPRLPADGTYTVTVVLTDGAGPSAPGSAQYVYDGTAPTAPVVDGPSGRTADPVLAWTFAVPTGTTATCALVAGTTIGPAVPCTSPFTTTVDDGTWALEVVLVDEATNASLPGRSTAVEVDTTAPPVPSFTVEPTSPSAADSFTWNWAPQEGTVSCRVLAGAAVLQDWAVCAGGVSVSTADLQDGLVAVELRSADDLGNTSEVRSSSVVLDRTAPAAPAVSGSSGAGRTPTAQWSWAADPGDKATCQFLLDGAPVGAEQPCFSGQVWDLPQDGSWAVAVRLTDQAQNTGDAGVSPVYVLDRVAPAAPTVTGPTGDGNATAVTWTVGGEPLAAVTCRLERDGVVVQDWGPCARSVATVLEGDGAWRLRATLTDAAGNTSPLTTSALYLLDTAAPALPVVQGPTGPSSATTVTWTWTGDTTAVATCQLLRDAVVVTGWERCATSERRTLTTDGGWLWQVRLTDAAGNVAGPVDSPLYVLDTIAPDAPSVSAPASPSSSRTPAFVITGEDPATVTCRVLHRGAVLQDWAECDRTVALDLAGSPDGAYRVEARLTDAAGNRSATGSSTDYVLDTVAPAVPVVTGSSGDSSSATPTWSWTAEALARSECSLVRTDGLLVDWYACSSAHTPVLPAEGAWRLQVRVRDAADNLSGTATGPEYRFDATAPAAAVLVGPASPGRTTTPTWTFTGEAGAAASCMVTGPDATSAWTACASPYVVDLSGRPQGTYRLDVRLRDAAGNTSTSGWGEYVLDTVAPAPATVSAPASPSADPLATWSLLVAEPGLSAVCTLLRDGAVVDGGPCAVDTAGTTWSTDLSSRGDGTYRLSVVVTDAAGNASTAAGADYVYDTTAPVAVTVVAPLSPGSSRTPSWQLTTEPGGRIDCQFGDVTAFSPCAASGSFVADLVGSPDGSYALTVRATDRAGNVGPATTTTYLLDTEQPLAPVVTAPTPSPGRQTTPTWTWTAERNSSATCTLVRGTRVVSAAPCADRLSVLLPEDGTYVLSVTATDAAGNASLPGTATYTLDTTAPDLPVIVGPGSPSSIASPVFGFDAEEGAVVECRTLRGPGLDALVVDGTGWRPCPEGVLALTLTVEQTYRLDVRATDAAGNTSTVAEYVYVYDRNAPAGLTDLVLPTSPGNVVRPAWTFTAPAGSTTSCRLTGPAGEVESGPCTSGFRPASALTVEGRYVLRIDVRDGNGNVGTNDLLYVLDTTGPEAPVVTPSGAFGRVGQVQWGWTLDPTATAQCQLEHDGRVVQTWQTCVPGVQFLGQWGDGAYVLSVRGVDRVGNAGAPGRGSYTWRSAGPAALGVSTTSPTTGGPGPVLWTFPVPADAVTVTCGVRRDGAFVSGPTACRGSYLMNLAGQRDGGYEVVVRFADLVGNTTEQVRSYVLSTSTAPGRAPAAPPASAPPSTRTSFDAPESFVPRAAGDVVPLLPAGTPPVDRPPNQPLGLGDGSEGIPQPAAEPQAPPVAPRPGLALDGGRLSGSAAVEAIKDVATETIKRPELPIVLLLLVLLFLLVQNRIDHRDPKLAAAGQDSDDELEFRPLRGTFPTVPRAGGAPA